ncbi:MAG: hypothetical protein ACE5HN_02605 [Nitrospiria bacterium]
MKRFIAIASIGLILGTGLAACGGGGGSGTTAGTTGGTTSKSGFELPTELSAVPTNGSTPAPSGKASFKSKLKALQAAADPGTDYSKAETRTFVNEPTLEQFKIIEQVLQALAQTKYADPANVNQGPYKVMVAWQDEQNGVQTKTLEPWVVDSSIIVEGGKEINRARAWIEESMGGMTQLIKAEFKISAAATKNADGSYKNYGAWTLNVKFGDTATDFFAADASVGANGEAVIKIHENFSEGPSFTHEVKAIFHKSDAAGFGKVSFPDWESCMDPTCTPAAVVAKYAYNANHIAVQKGTGAVQFKDRTASTEMTHRYGMFDSVTGDDVMRTKSFGFPVEYIDSNGNPRFAYYGAWQGRHELWGDGGTVPAGTTVTRQDRGPNQTETYTVSVPFKGVLTRRTPVAAALDDIKNIPVETWINDHFELKFLSAGPSGAGWYKCTFTFDPANPTAPPPPTCDALFTAFDTLIIPAGDQRKFVNIDQWDMTNSLPVQYVYLGASAPGGAGLYKADFDMNTGQLTPITTTPYLPADGDQLFVNIGGSIYIEYKGAVTGWVEKELASFDQRTWTPVFNDAGDKPYTLPLDREFYINSKGVNYIVIRKSAGTEVWIEIQKTANPLNASTFVAANTVFKSQWDPDVNSTYEFVTDPTSANFMKLVYKTIGQNDKDPQGNPNPSPGDPTTVILVGDVLMRGEWGLVAYVGGNATTDQFNWEYPDQGGGWGTQQYLKDANGFVLLSDPIQLAPVVVTNNAGVQKTLSLQFDGWMHGLPDLFHDLMLNDFVMDQAISDKIINIPAGTVVTDAQDSTKQYLVKPLEVSQFLTVVTDPGTLDITTADGVDLTTVPNFVEHNMGAKPVVTTVKYSEGRLVQ